MNRDQGSNAGWILALSMFLIHWRLWTLCIGNFFLISSIIPLFTSDIRNLCLHSFSFPLIICLTRDSSTSLVFSKNQFLALLKITNVYLFSHFCIIHSKFRFPLRFHLALMGHLETWFLVPNQRASVLTFLF